MTARWPADGQHELSNLGTISERSGLNIQSINLQDGQVSCWVAPCKSSLECLAVCSFDVRIFALDYVCCGQDHTRSENDTAGRLPLSSIHKYD
jgi:hypothetical protein